MNKKVKMTKIKKNEYIDYFFRNEKSIFMYYEMALMKQK